VVASVVASAAVPDSAVDEEFVESMLATSETRSGREFDSRFRASLKRRLLNSSDDDLRELQQSGALITPSAAGDSQADLVYTPVRPCRVVDTRLAGGSIAPATIRDFRVTGSALHAQGGNAAGCSVPFGPATAAVINFVAVNATGPGNLRAWDYTTPPQPAPNAAVVNYANIGLNIANGIAVPLCDPAATTCPFDVRVQADVSATHLVADVVGYFSRFPLESTAIPPGTMLDYGGASAPAGYLLCDGSAISRTTYAQLFTAIGTAFGGGDGTTTFNLPDLRGRFTRGRDAGAGRDPDVGSRGASAVGGLTGDNVGSLQDDQFRAHSHIATACANPGGGLNIARTACNTQVGTELTTGGAGGNETRPSNVYVNKIIKY
jgi:microcystin-dependent protein